MLPTGARDVPLTVGDQRKIGIYEISRDQRVFARRVELAEWQSFLADQRTKPFLQMFVDGEVSHPSGVANLKGISTFIQTKNSDSQVLLLALISSSKSLLGKFRPFAFTSIRLIIDFWNVGSFHQKSFLS